jgi:sialic acid synthase SpsE
MKLAGLTIPARPDPDHPPYVIAELGVNHDGSTQRALDLTRAAARAGAHAVKLQCFTADLLMSRAARLASYQAAAGETDPADMLRRLELPLDAMARVIDLAHALNIHAIVTVFSLELVAPARALPWDAFKFASPDIVNRPLLEAVAADGRPLILSTGAAEPDEIELALGWLTHARDRTALLQCVSSYPTPQDHAELGGIPALQSLFPGPVGYSDHTPDEDTGALAAALGAVILEKHTTHSRAAPGPDHAASLEPDELARYVQLSRRAAAFRADPRLARAQPVKRLLPLERDVRALSRQSVVATRPLEPGLTLTRADLTIKRPGAGIPAARLAEIIGRRTARTVHPDTPLLDEDLA